MTSQFLNPFPSPVHSYHYYRDDHHTLCIIIRHWLPAPPSGFFFLTVRRVPPHFSIPPESVEVMPGGAVNITCVAVGSPMPFVKWRLGAVELTPEDNIPIGKNVLMLVDIRESANYTCVAASDLGNIEAAAQVKVKGLCRKPSPPLYRSMDNQHFLFFFFFFFPLLLQFCPEVVAIA